MNTVLILFLGIVLMSVITEAASSTLENEETGDENNQFNPQTLEDDILNLSEKTYNDALVIFTTNYTDTVIDALRQILANRGLVNFSQPNALENFVACNNISTDAFFREVDQSRDYLAESQVDLFYAWTAYLEGNMTEAQAQYDRALAAYNQFLPVAAGVHAQIDSWHPCPSPSNGPSGNSNSQTSVKKQNAQVQRTTIAVENTDDLGSDDQKTVQKVLDKTAKTGKESQKTAKITGAVVEETETKEGAPIGLIARIVAFFQSLF